MCQATEECLTDLHNLENAIVVNTAQLVLANMRAEQSHLQEEAEKKIEYQARHLDEMQSSYPSSLNEFQKMELNAKSVKDAFAYAQDTIAKAQILLQDN